MFIGALPSIRATDKICCIDSIVVDTTIIGVFSLFLLLAFFLIPMLISNIVSVGYDYAYATTSSGPTVTDKTTIKSSNGPVIDDPNLKTEVVYSGDKFPSTMAFLGSNDILLLQKNNGTVDRIVNGNRLSNPLLRLNVSAEGEGGMLGIAIAKHDNGPTYVFLYYTKAGTGSSNSPANVLYRYEFVNEELIDPKLLLSFPAGSAPFHNGGKVIIGPDNNVYVTSGDLFVHRTKAQNFENRTDPDLSGGILRVTQDGKPVGNGIIGDKFPLNLYYAYGIRNSFGIDFDPVSGTLWDTENGPNFGDEINLVEPGFNSGWAKVQGVWKVARSDEGKPPTNQGQVATHPETNLFSFGGMGKYRPPEFTWQETVGITAIKFLNSTKLGEKYKNQMFVGDFNNGILYHFQLNKQRNGLIMSDALADKTDSYRSCDLAFKCTVNSSIGWQNINRSLQISTNTTNKNTWSWKDGEEITVATGEGYSLISHMKLNKFVIASHVSLQGYNESSKSWYPLTTQCPPGTNGPLDWKEFRCNITIPANTTKIKPVFNAGWSSEEGKEAVTLFDNISINQPVNWIDPLGNCNQNFKCTVNSTTEQQNIKTRVQLSTNTTNKNMWSEIYYNKPIDVNPGLQYQIVIRMKLNQYATQSHVALQGYNESSKSWYQLTTQCPPGTNGPLEWKEFRCNITIPANTTKIKPVFNAGWSSEEGKEAVTLFDAVHLDKFLACTNEICKTVHSENNATLNFDFERPFQFGYGFGRITDLQIGPDGYLYVLSLQVDSPVYPGQFFPYDAAAKETIYRIILAKN